MTTVHQVGRQSAPVLRDWFVIARGWLERFPLSTLLAEAAKADIIATDALAQDSRRVAAG